MKIAYVFSSDIWLNDGVTKKIASQAVNWNSSEVCVRRFCIVPLGRHPHSQADVTQLTLEPLRFTGRLARLFSPTNLFADLESFAPDIVYLRYELPKPFHWKLVRKYPVIVEINTHDVREFKSFASGGRLLSRLKKTLNAFSRVRLLSRAKGLVVVTHELAHDSAFTGFKLPTAIIPNSIDLTRPRALKSTDVHGLPRVLFMGTPGFSWHGLDKLVTLAERTTGRLEIVIVGAFGDSHPSLPSNVELHPLLQGTKLESVIASCHIGLGTLALHRKGMDEACPLKTRDYLAHGMPLVLGYRDSAWIGTSAPEWILELPNTESNISDNVESIVSFCHAQRSRVVAQHEIAPFIDSAVLEKSRLTFMKRHGNSGPAEHPEELDLAFILPSLKKCGPVNVAVDIIRSLAPHVRSIRIFCLTNTVDLTFEEPNIDVVRIGLLDRTDLSRFHAVHSHCFRSDLYVFLNRPLRSKTRFLSTMHNYMFQDIRYASNGLTALLKTLMWLFLLMRQDLVIALSSDMQAYYRRLGIPLAKLRSVWNGRSMKAAVSEDTPSEIQVFKRQSLHVVGTVSQLVRRKGLEQLIEVLAVEPSFAAVIIGDGPERLALEALATRLKVQNRVTFLGHRNDIARFLPHFSAYALPSRSEGFPLSLIEAGFLGVPCVVSDIAPVTSVFPPNSLQTFQLDDVASFKNALKTAIQNRAPLIEAMKNFCTDGLTADAMAAKYFELYRFARPRFTSEGG